ncbi:unnamed protein product [Strongylus vulgaris]|uniref:GP-PDE domain-containing protein n=1 Tax=Strongylus vulgaris TaxID=40348 RepID=A0A3P7LGZ0_STRVU|nr:unnamed protein product [Strongylus vulgaris]
MLVKSLPVDRSLRDNIVVSWGRYWRKRSTLEDMQPVIYHDFHVMVEVAGRKRDLFGQVRHHQLAIKDLCLDQLHLLHLEHPDEHLNKTWRVTPSEEEESEDDNNPFPHLKHVLDSVSSNVGFNIEIKYPMKLKDGTHECPAYNIERNDFVDVILRNVIEGAGKRRVIFSSFDPDVCSLISLKQHIYPVMLLVVGPTTRYTPFQDIRTDSSKLAVNFAAGNGLLGVNFHSEELLQVDGLKLRMTSFSRKNVRAFHSGRLGASSC